MKQKGCKEEDILSLLDQFASSIYQIEKAFNDLAQPESQIKVKRDIGMSPSPAKSGGKVPELKLLMIGDLTQFINKIEDVVDTVLQTLQQHIQKNTSNRTKTMDLGTFFDHVSFWAENLWHDRVEATAEENNPADEQPKKSVDL